MILVSKCLAGCPCRYDGESNLCEAVKCLVDDGLAVTVCPEESGGLPTPRLPSERRGNSVVNREGVDVTEAFEKGAAEALRIARENDCRIAVLKARSPSCGIGEIYDGSFSGVLKSGNGVAADLLKNSGITVLTEEDYQSGACFEMLTVDKAVSFVKELFRGNAGGHDAGHTLRVYRNAMRIADAEPGCDRFITALAALLHDADDRKLFQTENDRNARSFLARNGVSSELTERICEAIDSVSFSRNRGRVPDTLEGKIVQDADRLDAIGAVGIARTFAYGGEHGRPLSESVQHFYDKLLLLKDTLNTASARILAEDRHAFLEAFLQQLREETGYPLSGEDQFQVRRDAAREDTNGKDL